MCVWCVCGVYVCVCIRVCVGKKAATCCALVTESSATQERRVIESLTTTRARTQRTHTYNSYSYDCGVGRGSHKSIANVAEVPRSLTAHTHIPLLRLRLTTHTHATYTHTIPTPTTVASVGALTKALLTLQKLPRSLTAHTHMPLLRLRLWRRALTKALLTLQKCHGR